MSLFVIKSILMSLLPFYRVDFPTDTFPKDFMHVEYVHGREARKQTIKEGDPAYIAIKKLTADERQGWRYDLTTYAPNNTFISAKLTINCLDHKMVVNYQDKNNDWIQISKTGVNTYCPSVPERV